MELPEIVLGIMLFSFPVAIGYIAFITIKADKSSKKL